MPNNDSKHLNCPCEIRWEPGGLGRPGLFCRPHNAYIEWLSESDAFRLIDAFDLPETIHQPKKTNKKASQPKGTVLKNKQRRDSWQRFNSRN